MRSKRNKRELGKLEGAHEALMSVALVLEVGEAPHSERVDNHEAVPPEEDVAEDVVLDEILLIFPYIH